MRSASNKRVRRALGIDHPKEVQPLVTPEEVEGDPTKHRPQQALPYTIRERHEGGHKRMPHLKYPLPAIIALFRNTSSVTSFSRGPMIPRDSILQFRGRGATLKYQRPGTSLQHVSLECKGVHGPRTLHPTPEETAGNNRHGFGSHLHPKV